MRRNLVIMSLTVHPLVPPAEYDAAVEQAKDFARLLDRVLEDTRGDMRVATCNRVAPGYQPQQQQLGLAGVDDAIP